MPEGTPTGATPGPSATPGQGTEPTTTTGGATPPASTPAKPPATGDEPLGEGGKAALQKERDAREKAERRATEVETELQQLKAATQSDSDKALEKARKEGEGTATEKWQGLVRRARVAGALEAAGVGNAKLRETIAGGADFATLKVSDSGEVEGLEDAITKAKADFPEAFGKVAGTPAERAGTVTRGSESPTPPPIAPGAARLRYAYEQSSKKQ